MRKKASKTGTRLSTIHTGGNQQEVRDYLKLLLNENVLSYLRKADNVVEARRYSDRLFQALNAAAGKARSPTVMRHRLIQSYCLLYAF